MLALGARNFVKVRLNLVEVSRGFAHEDLIKTANHIERFVKALGVQVAKIVAFGFHPFVIIAADAKSVVGLYGSHLFLQNKHSSVSANFPPIRFIL